MKQVYKCDFCIRTNESKAEMEKHELNCSFNPKAKGCHTCKHFIDVGMPMSGPLEKCNIGKEYKEMRSAKRIGNCNKWEIEDNN